MGLMNTLKNALGLEQPLKVGPAPAFALDSSARSRLDELPEGHAIHIGTRRSAHGRTVQVDEGARQGPSPAEYPGLTIGDRDLDRLRGLVLNHKDSAWFVSTHLDLRAKETPNPNGRLYSTNRILADGQSPLFFEGNASEMPLFPALVLQIPGTKNVLLRANTLTVERIPDTPWDGIDTGISSALRTYFLGLGHRLTSEDVAHGGLMGEVQAVLAQTILPAIHRDGGDLQLLSVDDGVARVRLQGACKSCPASSATLKHGVERTLVAAFPGQITRVENVTDA